MSDVAEEEPTEESSEETAEEPEEKTAPEAAPEAAAASPRTPTDELKVVIIMKADKIMLGVQSPDCDPVYTTMTGSLAAALKKVSALVKEAKEKWAANPRYPKADLPAPPPPPAPARVPVSTPAREPTKPPSFF
ncbi:hypothetical protein ES705_17350 [subsurface metagenome]